MLWYSKYDHLEDSAPIITLLATATTGTINRDAMTDVNSWAGMRSAPRTRLRPWYSKMMPN